MPHRSPAVAASRIVATAVLILGPLLQLVIGGFEQAGRFSFWFGLYGWFCMSIVAGFLAYLVVRVTSPSEGKA